MYKYLTSIFSIVLIVGCVSNETVRTVMPGDYEMNCQQLMYELSGLGQKFEDAEDDSGATGKNIALGIFFWPGIIVNERQSGRNEDSINDRIVHLNKLYSNNCLVENTED